MSESANLLKANKLIAGRPCAWCSIPIEFGQDVAICKSCEAPLHMGCWSEKGGCATAECVNAPLKRLEVPEIQQAPPGMRFCPHCGEVGFTNSRETMNAVGGAIFVALFVACIVAAALFADGCSDVRSIGSSIQRCDPRIFPRTYGR